MLIGILFCETISQSILVSVENSGILPSSYCVLSFKRGIIIVLKPGPARRVNPGPGHGTGPGLSKNPPGSWPGETRPTRRVDPEPG
jgi:hypothetical protein